MPEHANCKSCKCAPAVEVYDFPVSEQANNQLPTFVGLSVASVLQSSKEPYQAELQLRFEYDAQYLRDKLVIRLTRRQ